MKRDQKGFTIVELLIAVAILSIVVASVCGFILVGSRSYAAGNSDINVQQEAQLALNQMSDVVIDTTRSVTYTGFDAGGTTTETALKDAEFSFTPEDKSLVMLNGTAVVDPGGGPDPIIEEGNGNKNYHFYWDKSEETLFYAEAPVADPVPDFGDPTADWVTLASHVTDFSVDLSQVEEKRVVMLALTFEDGVKEYVTSNNVTIRNKVGVNDAELEAINKKKTLVITPRDNAIIEPGETYHFSTPKVTGENVTDRSVTWSLKPSADLSGGTVFTDTANGILKVADDQKAGVITAVITTNAVDSDGNHASCDVDVHIKRVYPEGTGVVLAKTTDSNVDNGPNEISPGCTFTITATVSGWKLGEVCSVCGDDVTVDKQVNYQNNPYGLPHIWRVYDPSSENGATTSWNPNEYIDIIDSAPDHATFYMHPDAPTSDQNTTYGVVIQCISTLSELGNAHGRHYDTWVPGAISFKMVKNKESAEPYGGNLKYGEQTLDEKIRAGLSTDHAKYATAIRVVDNSGKMPDRVLLYFTIGGGANYRICPDLFDLDLNGSYTFYMQAIDPVSKENREKYEKHEIGQVIEDGADAIREEYFAHLDTSRPYGYVGDKYPHGKVFYAKLDRPKITINYQGVEYKGRPITYAPINIYTVGVGSGIVGEIKPSHYENIESNQGMEGMRYSLYKGDGENRPQWDKLYWFNDETMSYQGNNMLGDNAVEVNPGGNPFMKLNHKNNVEKISGSYHVIPGMLYRNKAYNHYEIIGWSGFDYPNLPREVRYYEFDESTIHVDINTDFTMELNHDRFKGGVLFPLPKEMEKSPLFPDFRNLDWQISLGEMWLTALREGRNDTENVHFSYVRYRYISNDNAWEVEPVEVEYDWWNRKIKTYSYGLHKCKENDKKWERLSNGSSKEKELVCNLEGVMVNGELCKTYFPLPGEDAFPFRGGASKISCTYIHQAYKMSGSDTNPVAWLEWNADVRYVVNGNKHTITFVKRGDESVKFGTFECTDGAAKWTKVN